MAFACRSRHVSNPVAYRRHEGAGSVTVLYGSPTGLGGARSSKLLPPGGPRSDVAFGPALAAADFDGDGRADLTVGAPGVRGGSSGATDGPETTPDQAADPDAPERRPAR